MPAHVPPIADEREGLLAYLTQQRQTLRATAHGLTDDQARMTPTASTQTNTDFGNAVAGDYTVYVTSGGTSTSTQTSSHLAETATVTSFATSTGSSTETGNVLKSTYSLSTTETATTTTRGVTTNQSLTTSASSTGTARSTSTSTGDRPRATGYTSDRSACA